MALKIDWKSQYKPQCLSKARDFIKASAAKNLANENAKPNLDLVKPASGGWREVEKPVKVIT